MGLTFKKEDNLERVFEEFGIQLPDNTKNKPSLKNTLENDSKKTTEKSQKEEAE